MKYFLRYFLELQTTETRDSLHCAKNPCDFRNKPPPPTFFCDETITILLKISIDGVAVPEITAVKTETRDFKGRSDCVCWLQEENFRRAADIIGFSHMVDSGFPGGDYRMVNSGRKLIVHMGNENGDFVNNVFANHNF